MLAAANVRRRSPNPIEVPRPRNLGVPPGQLRSPLRETERVLSSLLWRVFRFGAWATYPSPMTDVDEKKAETALLTDEFTERIVDESTCEVVRPTG